MLRNSSDADSYSDNSFGWIDMEQVERAKKASGDEDGTSDTGEDSSDDSDVTQFELESESRTVLNAQREQNSDFKRKEPVTIRELRGRVKDDSRKASDTMQFDTECDGRRELNSVRDQKSRSKKKNSTAFKEDPLKASGTTNAFHDENSEDSSSDDSAVESRHDSDRKDLKPFIKRLSVKVEKISHTMSDDSDIGSPFNDDLRVKTESITTRGRIKSGKHVTLIEGVLLDSVQPLPFHIGANEDVWVVQCPYELSESMLRGKTLNFSGFSCAEQFESSVLLTASPKSTNLLLPKSPGKLLNLTPTGHIIFKQKEMVPHTLHPVCNEDNVTSLPTGLKIRHPLFGADISLVQTSCPPLHKKKKKKKKKQEVWVCQNENEEMEAENTSKFSSDLDVSPLHKKKKKQQDVCENENEKMEAENTSKFSSDLDVSALYYKKKKKKKQMDEYPADFRQEPGAENNSLQLSSFHSNSSPSTASEKNTNGFAINDSIQSELHQKKHKKIKHEPEEAVPQEITNFLPESVCVTPSKKRKHKHLEYSIEDGRQIAGKTSDEPENIFLQKKKKQKYETESSTSYGGYATREKSDESSKSFAENLGPITQEKKKHYKFKKDFRSEYTDSVKNELAVYSPEAVTADPMTDTLLHTLKKKKKKMKENATELMADSNVETTANVNCISTKKKKKAKMETSDEHLGQLSFDAKDSKSNVCNDISGADLDYFDVNTKKLHKEKRRKFEERSHSPEFIEQHSTHNKSIRSTLDISPVKQESSYFDDPALTEMLQKKKKKRKSE